MNRQNVKLLLICLGVFVISALAVYLFFSRQAAPASGQGAPAASTANVRPTDQSAQRQANGNEDSFFPEVFGTEGATREGARAENWTIVLVRVTIRLTLAALFAALLAFRPRKFSVLFKRNLFVAQTQILLAVVASALMMIVGDSAARAFGIFAAASLVRFRTNIKDPKEITVLLVSLAIGLATGVGRWELGLIMSFFVLLLLWGLEYRERDLVTRAMELTVKTRNVGTTQDALLHLFRKYDFTAEMRTIDRPDGDDETGSIVYFVDIGSHASTD